MMNSRILAAAAAATLCLGTSAMAAELSSEQLQRQVAELQAKVAQLETRQTSGKDVDAAVARVMADSNHRSQLMAAEGFTAGYSPSRGFVLQSADGSFLLHPYLQFQIRNTTNYSDAAKPNGNSSTDNGFELRRLKFGFDGNAFSPDFSYTFQWATDRKSGVPGLEDAWIKYKFADQWAVRAGQFKDPVFREGLVSSTRQLAADRSLINQILENSDNYIQGISLIYDNGEQIKAEMALTDGFGSANTNFQDPPATGSNFGVAGRVEYMAMGTNWKNYADFTAMGKKDDTLVLGLGGDWTQSGDTDSIYHTADAQWTSGASGLAIYGGYVGRYRHTDTVPVGADKSFYDWGFIAQVAYMVNTQWEVFGRYDYIRLDNDFTFAATEKNIHEIAAGVNYYLKGHNAKFTADVTYLPNGSPIGADSVGILPSTGADNQVVARLQFQVVL